MFRATRTGTSRLVIPVASVLFLLTACHVDSVVQPGATAPGAAARHDAFDNRNGTDNDDQDNDVENSGPNYDLNVALHATVEAGGTGHIKFRQPVDADVIALLDTRVEALKPETHYLLQRATDTNLDGICTGVNWLTLGKGAVAQDIATNGQGKGSAELFRVLTAFLGTTFDIRFRVIEAATSDVVLTSRCYQFTVRQ